VYTQLSIILIICYTIRPLKLTPRSLFGEGYCCSIVAVSCIVYSTQSEIGWILQYSSRHLQTIQLPSYDIES